MSKIDLDSKAKQAFDDVSNSKLTYALLKHEGTSNKVIVASTGDDILDLIDDLNDGTIMYALIRFVINDATKFVYVGWCPEGIANQIFKGKFQNWNKDMEFYLKGRYHLSVYARNEEDIDQASWIKKLKVGAGSSYTQSSNAKDLTISQAKQNIASAKTDVKKTEVAIDDSERNKFWEKQQEDLKKQEEKKKLPPPRSDYKKTDERNQFWQGQSTSTTSSGSTVVKSSDRISEIQQIKNNSNQFWQKQQEQTNVQESDNKPKEVVRGNKDLFKKFESMSVKTEEPKPVARQPISTGAAKKPVFQPKHEEPAYEEPQHHHYEEPAQESYHYEEPQHEEPAYEEPAYEEPPQQTYHQPRVPPPFHQPRYDSEEEEEPEQEPEPVQEPISNKPSKPKGYLERQVEQGNISPSQAEEIISKPTKLPPPPVPTKPKLPELVAVFDFDGQDGEELSFAEGDTLYLVQDEGEWWLAENTNGQQGYIPSNYVEMKE